MMMMMISNDHHLNKFTIESVDKEVVMVDRRPRIEDTDESKK